MGLSFAESYEALRAGVVGRERACDVVVVSGPDALSYLQGQCTQDLSNLSLGETAEALLLSPQGKLELAIRVARTGEESFVVEVPSGYGEVTFERLRRFKLRIKATLEAGTWRLVEVRGPLAELPGALVGGVAYRARVIWPGLSGYDLVGPSATLPEGVPDGDEAAFEAARIEAGLPLLGSELTERTIPHEAGIVERMVSFKKGCFTGQELVARIDARGAHVPRHLRGLVFEEGSHPAVGDEVVANDRVVGTVTAVAHSPQLGGVALGYLRRELEFPSAVGVRSPNGGSTTAATAFELPLFHES